MTRSFCGLVQQFEAFFPDITAMMKPITEIMSTKSVFQWLPAQEEAFRRVIAELQSPRVLAQYRPGAKLTLETGVGYALWQEEPDGTKRLLRCGSRTVSDPETQYSVTKSEVNAVVVACHKITLYLQGTKFEVIVDHKPLVPIPARCAGGAPCGTLRARVGNAKGQTECVLAGDDQRRQEHSKDLRGVPGASTEPAAGATGARSPTDKTRRGNHGGLLQLQGLRIPRGNGQVEWLGGSE